MGRHFPPNVCEGTFPVGFQGPESSAHGGRGISHLCSLHGPHIFTPFSFLVRPPRNGVLPLPVSPPFLPPVTPCGGVTLIPPPKKHNLKYTYFWNTHNKSCNLLQQIRMLKILMVNHIDLPRHTQIFDGKPGHLSLAQFSGKGTSCKNRHSEVSSCTRSFNGSDIIDLQRYIQFIERDVIAFQMGDEQIPGSGIRQPEDQTLFFSSSSVTMLFLESGLWFDTARIRGIRVQHDGIKVVVHDFSFDNRDVQLVRFQFLIKIIYGIK